MLWGTSDGGGTPNGPGTQGSGQLDDDTSGDGDHQIPEECYTYDFGFCPDPLGAMAQVWGDRLDPPGNRADFDGDGLADTRDFIAFLQAWRRCNPRADCNNNGRCASSDVICFLDMWSTCRD